MRASQAMPPLVEWLESLPAPRRLGYALEFLLQWIACADDRFDVAVRDRLLAASIGSLDPYEIVKRRAYSPTTGDIDDALRWLRDRADDEQRRQAFDLLLLLTLDEGRPTPVRNTLLRFIVDAIGLGSGHLMQRCATVYRRPLERLPRPDLDDWWEEWEAGDQRSLEPERERRLLLDRLALQPGAVLDFATVDAAHERLAAFAAPERYHRLGAREQALARWQRARIGEARDALVEDLR